MEHRVLPEATRGDAADALFAGRIRRGRLIAFDVLAAAGYTLVILTVTLSGLVPPAVDLPRWAGALIIAGTGLPVAVRRIWPLPVFGVVFACTVAATLLGLWGNPFIAAAYALYTVALTRTGRMWLPTVVVGLVTAFGAVAGGFLVAPGPWRGTASQVMYGGVLLAGAWTAGRLLRERRAYLARSAEQLAEHAVTRERLRIARELHDIVAHSMSLITVKAGTANYVLRRCPDEANDALRVIETASRSALTEMRRMLGVLRNGADADPLPATLGPAPGIAGLPALADQAAAAGVRVELDVRDADRLPESAGLTVYRIVQEALTNVVKHAAPAACRVMVRGDGGTVRIEVVDDGPGVRPPPERPAAGHGLIGMRERVMMYDGTLTAGHRPEGGFAVSARFRYEPVDDAVRTGRE